MFALERTVHELSESDSFRAVPIGLIRPQSNIFSRTGIIRLRAVPAIGG